MNNRTVIIAGVVVGLLLILVVPRFFTGNDEEEGVVQEQVQMPAVEEETLPEPVQPSLPEPEPAPVAVVPEPEPVPVEPEPEPVELPDLNESDPFVIEQAGTLENGSQIIQQLTSGQTVRKFVVMVDNMSRGDIPVRDLPVLGPRMELLAEERGENLYVMDPASYDRFDEAVDTFTSIRTEDAVAMITLFGPLFQSAYAELGYRERQFSDVLDQAIENVLNAPLIAEEEILLTRPSVFYKYENPELENLSSVEKLLIRMGPENAARVQEKVADIRDAMNASAMSE